MIPYIFAFVLELVSGAPMAGFRSDRFHQTVHRFLEAAVCPELMPAALHEIAVTCNAEGAFALPVAGDCLIAPVVSEGCAGLLDDFLKWPNPARNSRMVRGLRLFSQGWPGIATERECYTPEELARDAFQQEFMRPRGFGSYAGATLVQMAGYSMPITIERLAKQGPFEAAEVRQMNKLMSQLGDAATLVLRMSLASAGRVTDAMAQAGQPLAVIGADGRMLHANALFQALLESGSGLRLRNGCLGAFDVTADKAIAGLIFRALAYDGEFEKPLGAVIIPRPPNVGRSLSTPFPWLAPRRTSFRWRALSFLQPTLSSRCRPIRACCSRPLA
jgi:hypothetical protein